MAKEAYERFLNAQMIEQDLCRSGILGGDRIDRREDLYGAIRDIVEVAYRRRNDVERTREDLFSHWSYAPVANVAKIDVDRPLRNLCYQRRPALELVLGDPILHFYDEVFLNPQ